MNEPTARLAEVVAEHGQTVATIESLTGGLLADRMAQAEGAGDWFRGGIVAYAAEVKHDLLGVPDVPVVSRPSAEALATRGRELLGADVAIAVTGVGGPGPEQGLPAGTVWLAVADAEGCVAEERRFHGSPEVVCAATCDAAVALLLQRLGAG